MTKDEGEVQLTSGSYCNNDQQFDSETSSLLNGTYWAKEALHLTIILYCCLFEGSREDDHDGWWYWNFVVIFEVVFEYFQSTEDRESQEWDLLWLKFASLTQKTRDRK